MYCWHLEVNVLCCLQLWCIEKILKDGKRTCDKAQELKPLDKNHISSQIMGDPRYLYSHQKDTISWHGTVHVFEGKQAFQSITLMLLCTIIAHIHALEIWVLFCFCLGFFNDSLGAGKIFVSNLLFNARQHYSVP